jgi:hypothetical protein
MIRAMRRRMQRAGTTASARRGRIPHDYQDRITVSGPKTAWRGAWGRTSPGYDVMCDGSIRRA